jgi:hypothetical protein
MATKIVVKSVSDVVTLQAARPDLVILKPLIPVGHVNEAKVVARLNDAQNAPTLGMQNDAINEANFASQVLTWKP